MTQSQNNAEELDAKRVDSLMQAKLSSAKDTRLMFSTMRGLQEESAKPVSDERTADCPKAIRLCSTVFGAICAVFVVMWAFETFSRFSLWLWVPLPYAAWGADPYTVLSICTVVSFVLAMAFYGLKKWFYHWAWIDRMRAQEQEKNKG
jgi:hypothetical protein